jgi:hypothetical protein
VRDDLLKRLAVAALVMGAACTPLHRGADLARGDASAAGPAIARGDAGGDTAPPLVRFRDAAPVASELDPPTAPLDAGLAPATGSAPMTVADARPADTYLPPHDVPPSADPPPADADNPAPPPAPTPTPPSPAPPAPTPVPPVPVPPAPPPSPDAPPAPPPPSPEPDAASSPPASDAAPPPPPPPDAGPSNCGAAAPARSRFRFEVDQAGALPLGSASDPAGDWYGGGCSADHRGAGCSVKAFSSGGVGLLRAGCEVTEDPEDCRCRVRWWAEPGTRIRCEITITERRACPPR